MWRDEQGVFHSVALPEPRSIMAPEFADSLQELISKKRIRRRLIRQLDRAEIELVSEAGPLEDVVVGELRGAMPGEILLAAAVCSIDDVLREIAQVAFRWRLDALMAVADFVDDECG